MNTFGMLFADRCTWAHAIASAAQLVGIDRAELLDEQERRALDGEADPRVLDKALA